MRIHFIAIGGAAMHKLAICLHQKGDKVTGSDDELKEPSKSHLAVCGLLPEKKGWFPEKITDDIDIVLLGMHARPDNPELLEAKRKGLKICSLPEYLFQKMRDKMRVVIGGGTEKTMITAMVMHVLKTLDIKFDYLTSNPPLGFDTSLYINEDTRIAIIEGDEYLTSVIDKRPKFHFYQPHIAAISNLEWDFIDAYHTQEEYEEQYKIFSNLIERNGKLIYYCDNEKLQEMAENVRDDITSISYQVSEYHIVNNCFVLHTKYGEFDLKIFGKSNMYNIDAARNVCRQIGVKDKDFYTAITSFEGIRGKLQLLVSNDDSAIYYDTAHTRESICVALSSLKELYPNRKIIVCLELYSYSMLSKEYINHISGCLDDAFTKIVFFNHVEKRYEGITPITEFDIKESLGFTTVVYNDNLKLMDSLSSSYLHDMNLIFISPSNFSNMNLKGFAESLLKKV